MHSKCACVWKGEECKGKQASGGLFVRWNECGSGGEVNRSLSLSEVRKERGGSAQGPRAGAPVIETLEGRFASVQGSGHEVCTVRVEEGTQELGQEEGKGPPPSIIQTASIFEHLL